MSGTDEQGGVTSAVDDVAAVLDRLTVLPALNALLDAAGGGPSEGIPPTARVAIGLDTSAVLRLANKSRTDSIDYLRTRHDGPLILPGQVVQEFWNNSLAVIHTQADNVRRLSTDLAKQLREIGLEATDFTDEIDGLLERFEARYAFTYDPATRTRIRTLMESLQQRASVPYVPRERFAAVAAVRHSTKTPPGFKDAGHGDFFVWADFLLGLRDSQLRDTHFDWVVLVTGDGKMDWSRGGVAHPILAAEVKALVDVPLTVWTMDDLGKYVQAT